MTFSTLALLGFVAWVAAHLKTSRFDGDIVRGLHPYRRLMPYVIRKKSEAIVYFDADVDATELLRYIAAAEKKFPIDITHCLVAAGFRCSVVSPTVNRFVVGRRLYQRKWREITFSMKRKRMDQKAKLANVKLRLKDGETFRELCERIDASINVERSDQKTSTDKEYDLLRILPRPLLRGLIAFAQWLDYFNLAPRFLIEPDPLYTSMFVANLGSLGMRAGYHHLFEWGNCPTFTMAGRLEQQAVVVDGKVVNRTILPLRFTYDERVDDGLNAGIAIQGLLATLERPFEVLGCLEDDGSDARPLDTPPV